MLNLVNPFFHWPLKQTLNLTLQAHSVAYQLQLHPGQLAPEALFPIRYKTENQFLGGQPPHQPLRVLEVMLATSRSAVGKCLRQVQAHMRLQFQPHRPPVLGR
jgi:hypothetical protein